MTDTSLRDDGWSTPTHYRGGRTIEPRTFTEADPMTSLFVADWGDGGEESRWGATTYVGRPRGGRATEAPASVPATEAAGEPKVDEGTEAAPAPTSAESDRGLLANSRSMAVASLASRVTGFLRSVMLVAALGTGSVSIAYNSGNNLPNMIYELLLGGVLSSVLIPLLVSAEAEDEDGGLAYTQRLLSIAPRAAVAMDSSRWV